MVKIILKITGHVLDENKFGRFDIIVITIQQSMKKRLGHLFFFNFTIIKIEHHY